MKYQQAKHGGEVKENKFLASFNWNKVLHYLALRVIKYMTQLAASSSWPDSNSGDDFACRS